MIEATVESFLKLHEHCRIATISENDGFPHCVPVGYFYHEELVYIPTSSQSKKIRNLKSNPKCCVIVDVYDDIGKGNGVMLQGLVTVRENQDFSKIKELVEPLAGWKLDKWRVGKAGEEKVDSMIVFEPTKVVIIGTIA